VNPGRVARVAMLTAACVAAAGAGVLAMPARAEAQTTAGSCAVSPSQFSGADACRKALDLFSFIMPQVGVALAGGNPVLGEGGTLGGWPKRAVALRVTAVDGFVPKNTVPIRTQGASVASDFGAARTPIPVPSVDAAIGILPGIPAGLTNVLGVDAIVGATYLPTITQNDVDLAPSASNFAFSYGVRVGALQESSLVPGISVSYLRRRLPTMNLGYAPGNDTISIRNLSSTANSLRLVVSKRIAILGLSGGVGRDEIEGTASMSAAVNESVLGVPARASAALPNMRSKVTRNTTFVSASFGLPIVRIVGEFGWSSAGDLEPTVNAFGGRQTNEGYRYGTFGLAFRI
jgi:hypothetical protein